MMLFNVKTNVGTSDAMSCEGYDSVVAEITGATSCSIKFEGCIKFNGAETIWTELKVISMDTFDFADSITSAGLFVIPTNGLSKFRIVIESFAGEGNISLKAR